MSVMKKSLLIIAIGAASGAMATPFTGNDAPSNAMGGTGVASASAQNAFQFNPGLLADYNDDVDFGMTLAGVKFFIDDSLGFAAAAEAFTEAGGTWEQFQNVDSASLEVAVGNIPTTMTAIGTNITDIGTAITDINNAMTQGQLDTAVANLNTANAALTTNSASLDADVITVNAQTSNLNSTATSAQADLEGLSGKPLQIGVGIDFLNIAVPSEKLGLAFSLSSTTSVGSNLNVVANDLDPIIDLTGDLTEYTAEATLLTAAVTALAAANEDLSLHIQAAPAFTDPGYAAWEAELTNKQTAITDAQTDVNTAQANLETFNGSNGVIVNGSVVVTSSGDPLSEIEFVGANVTEIALSGARQFEFAGESVAIGITPKLQSFNIFEKTIVLADAQAESDAASADPNGYFMENTTTALRPNIDVGAAKSWDYYGNVRAGVALKDIIPWDLETVSGNVLQMRPKLRAGVAHETKFTKVALDLDITENQPLKYGVPTRYLGLGGELSLWNHAALRLGYRNNLSVENSSVVSGGIGLTPFGVGVELSAWGKPTGDATELVKDIGFTFQASINF